MANDVDYLKVELRHGTELRVGDRVPAIRAKDLDGKNATLDYSDGGLFTVLYVFTPTCVWCDRNLPNVKALSEGIAGRYRFAGISLSRGELKEYVTEHGLTFLVLSELSAETTVAYKMAATPETLVVSAQGEILKVWFGAYDGSLQKEIEDYFGVRLRGIGESENKETMQKKGCETCDQTKAPRPSN